MYKNNNNNSVKNVWTMGNRNNAIDIDSGGTFLCNPRIIARSPEVEMKIWTEECLVLPPSFTATVLRDASIVVQYETLDGVTQVTTLHGEIARCLQHEMDHDRGILIVDHVGLDELESYSAEMKEVEQVGHGDRMTLAYSRYIDVDIDIDRPTLVDGSTSTSTSTSTSRQLAKKKSFFVEPAYAAEEPKSSNNSIESEIDRQKKTVAADGNGSSSSSDTVTETCDEECRAQRKKIIEERRALMQQSKTNSRRQDLLDLSRQRAALYDTKYNGL